MLDKFTVLRNAEKFICSGQLKRAISEYEKLLKSTGDDPGILNTLGDLQLRNGQRVEALANYKRVVGSFLDSGFTAKAAAVLKKINLLDPADLDALQNLADLNQRRGLTSETALNLEALAEGYWEAGQRALALSTQEELLALRPSNPYYHLKLADLLVDATASGRRLEHLLRASRLFYAKRQLKEAERAAKKALEVDPNSEDALKLLEDISSGDETREEHITSAILEPGVEDLATYRGKDLDVEELFAAEAPSAESRPEVDGIDDLSVDLDFDLDSVGDEAGIPELEETVSAEVEEDYDDLEVALGIDQLGDREEAVPSPADGSEFDADAELLDAGSDGLDSESTAWLDGPEPKGADSAETPGVNLVEQLESIDFYLKLDLLDDARSAVTDLLSRFPHDHRVLSRAEALGIEVEPEAAGEGVSPGPQKAAAGAFESELEAALNGLFEPGVNADVEPLAPIQVTSDEGPLRSDIQSKYDLGVAYRGMSMWEDAAAKFEEAFELATEREDPQQAVACCIMLSEVYLQLSDADSSLTWSERGLQAVEGQGEEWKELEFNRAAALELNGSYSEGLECLKRIFGVDPEYRDVQAGIERLTPKSN